MFLPKQQLVKINVVPLAEFEAYFLKPSGKREAEFFMQFDARFIAADNSANDGMVAQLFCPLQDFTQQGRSDAASSLFCIDVDGQLDRLVVSGFFAKSGKAAVADDFLLPFGDDQRMVFVVLVKPDFALGNGLWLQVECRDQVSDRMIVDA